jgi:hypothetical protein
MPPQQGDGLLDIGDLALGFRAHDERDIGDFCGKRKAWRIRRTVGL